MFEDRREQEWTRVQTVRELMRVDESAWVFDARRVRELTRVQTL